MQKKPHEPADPERPDDVNVDMDQTTSQNNSPKVPDVVFRKRRSPPLGVHDYEPSGKWAFKRFCCVVTSMIILILLYGLFALGIAVGIMGSTELWTQYSYRSTEKPLAIAPENYDDEIEIDASLTTGSPTVANAHAHHTYEANFLIECPYVQGGTFHCWLDAQNLITYNEYKKEYMVINLSQDYTQCQQDENHTGDLDHKVKGVTCTHDGLAFFYNHEAADIIMYNFTENKLTSIPYANVNFMAVNDNFFVIHEPGNLAGRPATFLKVTQRDLTPVQNFSDTVSDSVCFHLTQANLLIKTGHLNINNAYYAEVFFNVNDAPSETISIEDVDLKLPKGIASTPDGHYFLIVDMLRGVGVWAADPGEISYLYDLKFNGYSLHQEHEVDAIMIIDIIRSQSNLLLSTWSMSDHRAPHILVWRLDAA